MSKVNNTQDKEEERKVKQLNQEIMVVFEKHVRPSDMPQHRYLVYYILFQKGMERPIQRIER